MDKDCEKFLAACENGDYATIKDKSLEGFGHVHFRCPTTHENGLHKCARSTADQETCFKIAEYLHELSMSMSLSGSSLNISVSKGNYTPLILATHFQNEGMVRAIAEDCRVKKALLEWTTDKEIVIDGTVTYAPFSTALHVAILGGNINIIKYLLSAGVSFWKTNYEGETALELAQKAKNTREIMKIFCDPKDHYAHNLIRSGHRDAKTIALLDILFANGVDVNSKDRDNYPLLYIATEKGDLETVRFLISRGAHINTLVLHTRYPGRYNNDMSVLHMATKARNRDTVECLLEAGADINVRDSNGRTALHILTSSRDGFIKKSLDCCELLLEHGARVNVPSAAGLTPLVNVFNNGSRIALAIYIISAGGDSSYVRNPTRSPVQLVGALKYIPKQLHKYFFDFLFESGFSIAVFIPTLQSSNSELVTYLMMKQQTTLSLKRLAANVIRRAMVPNSWMGLKELPLPPGFNKQYILLNPKQEASEWLKGNR